MDRRCIVKVGRSGKKYWTYPREVKNRASRDFYHAKQADGKCKSAFIHGLIDELRMPQLRTVIRHGLTEDLIVECCEAALARGIYPSDVILAHFARMTERLAKSLIDATRDDVPDLEEHEAEQKVHGDSA